GRLFVRHSNWLRDQFVGARRHVLRIRAVPLDVDESKHLIADDKSRGVTRSDRVHRPGELMTWDDWRDARSAVMVKPGASPVEFSWAHTAGVYPDQDIALAERWQRSILVQESRGIALCIGV